MFNLFIKVLGMVGVVVFMVFGLGNFGVFYLLWNVLKDLRKDFSVVKCL